MITAPSGPAATLNQIKARLRIDPGWTHEDEILTSWLKAGTDYVESLTNRKLITQEWELFRKGWGEVESELPFGETQSLTGVFYTAPDGTEHAIGEADYRLSLPGGDYARVMFAPFIDRVPLIKAPDAIRIRFVCGYGPDESYIPEVLKDAIALYVMGIRNDDDIEDIIEALASQYRYHII